MRNDREELGVHKSISAESLLVIIATLPRNSKFTIDSRTGNVTVWSGDNGLEEEWVRLGYIDVEIEEFIESPDAYTRFNSDAGGRTHHENNAVDGVPEIETGSEEFNGRKVHADP